MLTDVYFTVIVPAYNASSYLPTCLSSIEAQTFKNFELILVDDGSTDSTPVICDSFCHRYTWARCIHQENQGPFIARRVAFKAARGRYIMLVDADDAIAPQTLARCVQEITCTDADIVSFCFSYYDDFSTNNDFHLLAPGLYKGEKYQHVKKAVAKSSFNNMHCKAIRLSCIDLDYTYGPEYENYLMAEDLFQLMPIISSASSLARIDDVLYFYRQNKFGSTASWKESYIGDVERTSKRLLEYGERWDMEAEASFGVAGLYDRAILILNRAGSFKEIKECGDLFAASLESLSVSTRNDIKRFPFRSRIRLIAELHGSAAVGALFDRTCDLLVKLVRSLVFTRVIKRIKAKMHV